MKVAVELKEFGGLRELVLSEGISLNALADAIEVSFGWLHMHDYRFRLGDGTILNSTISRSTGVIQCLTSENERLEFEYDFDGLRPNGYVHEVRLVNRQQPNVFPHCTKVEGANAIEQAYNLGGLKHIREVALSNDAVARQELEPRLITVCGYHGGMEGVLRQPRTEDVDSWLLQFMASQQGFSHQGGITCRLWVAVRSQPVSGIAPIRSGLWPSYWQNYPMTPYVTFSNEESIQDFIEVKSVAYILGATGKDPVDWRCLSVLINRQIAKAQLYAECKNPFNGERWYVTAWLEWGV